MYRAFTRIGLLATFDSPTLHAESQLPMLWCILHWYLITDLTYTPQMVVGLSWLRWSTDIRRAITNAFTVSTLQVVMFKSMCLQVSFTVQNAAQFQTDATVTYLLYHQCACTRAAVGAI